MRGLDIEPIGPRTDAYATRRQVDRTCFRIPCPIAPLSSVTCAHYNHQARR